MLVGTRVLQGIGGAMMVPVGRLVVLRATAKAELVKAIAYLTWPALVAPVLAPASVALLGTYASWRWIFLINVPLGVAALVLAHGGWCPDVRRSGRAAGRRGVRADRVGVAALVVGLESLGDRPPTRHVGDRARPGRAGVTAAVGYLLRAESPAGPAHPADRDLPRHRRRRLGVPRW